MSKSIQQIRQELEAFAHEEFGVQIVAKEDSKFMWFLNFFVRPFNPDFMTRYITTIRTTVYGTRTWMKDDAAVVRVLAHELVHVYDWYQLKILFPILYLFPQLVVLGMLGAFGAFWSTTWLWCLAFGVFLAPLPAPFRAWAEFRGYAMTMAVEVWMDGRRLDQVSPDNPPKWIAQNFVGPDYYFMWPFPKNTANRLTGWLWIIKSGQYPDYVSIANRIEEIVSQEAT